MLRQRYAHGLRRRGFTLLEVMVALVVLSVGLLGVVKLETVAYSSTNIASKRSLAALAASSLAASMHVNRGYWTSADPPGGVIGVAGPVVTVTSNAPILGGLVGAPQDCTSTSATLPCAPAVMAAYDLQKWAAALQALLPNETATVQCGVVTPVSCTINIQWAENVVNINTQQAALNPASTLDNPSYTLFVEP
jgi:type IV pilus assembly protein PilV